MKFLARRVFFSFHYERDIWRANQVRNSWVTKLDRESAGFWDASLWEETKLKGVKAIEDLIDEGLNGTSVTAVLIGYKTAERKFVRYEIDESVRRGNGLLGIFINNLKDKNGNSDYKGKNPFDGLVFSKNKRPLSDFYYTYDWVNDRVYNNFGSWVEVAAQNAGK